MTKTVHDMARDIVRREGGWVDDKNDAGGATQYGVSLRYARGIGLDNDNDGDTDSDDIRLVTPEQAVDLYVHDFFTRPGFDKLPARIQAQMFDIAVNAGAPRAWMLLQRVLNEARRAHPEIGYDELDEDGRPGPRTRLAAAAAEREMGPFLSNALAEAREAFYRGLVAAKPSQRKFLKGWVARAREFREAV